MTDAGNTFTSLYAYACFYVEIPPAILPAPANAPNCKATVIKGKEAVFLPATLHTWVVNQ
jgi:hypothetical protein